MLGSIIYEEDIIYDKAYDIRLVEYGAQRGSVRTQIGRPDHNIW